MDLIGLVFLLLLLLLFNDSYFSQGFLLFLFSGFCWLINAYYLLNAPD